MNRHKLEHVPLLILALVNMLPAIEVEASWGICAIAIFSVVLSRVLALPSGASRMPPWVIYLAVFAASAFLLFEMFAPRDEPTVYILDLAHFMIFLCCCKFFELRSHRDVALVVVISFLLVVISAFASGSPLFGLVLAIDVSLGLIWLMSFWARREADLVAARRDAAFIKAGIAAPQVIIRPPVTPWSSLAKPAFSSGITLCMVSAMVFFILPRDWGRGLFVRIQSVIPAAVTGFTPEIQLGDQTLIEDDTPVMRIRLSCEGTDFDPSALEPYMRGMTFDRYNQGNWLPTKVGARAVNILSKNAPTAITRIARMSPGERVIEQEVSLDDLSSGTLFAMYLPLAFSSQDVSRVRVEMADRAIRTREQSHGTVRYKVYSGADLTPETVRLAELAWFGQTVPGTASQIDPQVREFAASFFQDLGDPSDPDQWGLLAEKVRGFLSDSDFEYSLRRPRRRANVDPVRDFLFESKVGHCEYFASAMTIMCQAVGIPARLVNGYFAGEYNAAGGFFQFRRKDAHAWVEVYVPDRGWVTFDPSPASSVRRRVADEGLWARCRRMMDLLWFKWSSMVVAFDAENRYDLVGRVGNWLEKLADPGDRPKSVGGMIVTILWGPDVLALWQRALYWLLLVLIVALAALILRALGIMSLMLKERLTIGRKHRHSIVRRPDARFYDRLLLLLASKGHVKPSHLSPREFADRIAEQHRDLSELPRLTSWFYEAQYGRRPLGRDRIERVRDLLKRLREDPLFGAG